MPNPTGRCGAKLRPCLAVAACTLAGLLPAAPAAAQQLDRFHSHMGLFSDLDGSGDASCGDHVHTRVTIGSSVGSFDLTNLSVRWPVPPNTRIVPGRTTLGFGPESDCTLLSGTLASDTEVAAFCSFLCRTGGDGTGGTCTQVGLDLQARLEILDPNFSDRVVLQASADADQIDPSLSDDFTKPGPEDPSVLTYEPCPPADPPVLEATLADALVRDLDGDGLASSGDSLRYSVRITNQGGPALDTVFAAPPPDHTALVVGSVAAPAGATVTSGNSPGDATVEVALGDLATGASTTLAFDVLVDSPLPRGVEELAAQGTVAAQGASTVTDDPDTRTLLDPTITPLDLEPDLFIDKTAEPRAAEAGSVVRFPLAFGNIGRGSAFDVRLRETVPLHTTFDAAASSSGWFCPDGAGPGTVCELSMGTLGAGALGLHHFAVRVDPALPAGATSTTNTAAITLDGSGGPDTDTSNNVSAAEVALLAEADLDLSKVGPATGRPADVLVYRLSASNRGTRDSPTAEVVDTVPPFTRFDAALSSPGWSCPDGAAPATTCILDLGSLAAGTTTAATFSVRVDTPLPHGAESLINTARLRDGAGSPPADASATTTLEAAPTFQLAKTGPASAAPHELVAFSLGYGNAGDQDAAGVEITDTVPAHSHFVAAASTSGWSCQDGSPPGTPCTLALGALAAGDGGNATFAVRLDPTVPAAVDSVTNTASLTDGDGSPPARDAATMAVDASPLLRVTKTGPTSARPGETIAFSLAYANEGNQDAAGTELRDTVPTHTTFDAAASAPGWTCVDSAPAGTPCTLRLGPLPVATTGTVTFAVRLADAVPADLAAILNTASLHDEDGTPPGEDRATVLVDAAPVLGVTKSGPSSARPGELLAFTLAYANTGDRDAPAVALHDTVPQHTVFSATDSSPGWSCPDGAPAGTSCTLDLGPLAAGASASATFAVRLAATVPSGTTVVHNTVVLTGAPEDPSGEDEVEVPVEAAADLRLAKDGPASASPGELIAFTLTYRNDGDRDTAAATLHETVPPHTAFSATDSAPGWSCPDGAPAGAACTLDLGPLAAGASGTATFAVRFDSTVPAGLTVVRNSAVLTGDPADLGDEDDAEVTVDAAPDLRLTKDGPASTRPGELIPFVLAYRNAGNRDTVAATLHETVPQHTAFSAADSTPGWSCPDGAPAGTTCTLDLGPLAAGASGTATFAVRLAATVPSGTTVVHNTVVLTGAPEDPSSEDEVEVPVEAAADLRLAKDGPASASPGELIAFTLTYRNDGDRDTAATTLHETVPPHTTFSATDSTPGWSCPDGAPAGTACTLDLGPLAAGASGTATFAVRFDSTVPAGLTVVRNTAVLTGGPDDPSGDDDGHDVEVDAAATLMLDKNGPGAAAPGDAMVYTLDYANRGDTTAPTATLTETVPEHATFVAEGSSPGWSCSDGAAAGTSCTLGVGDLDPDAAGTATFALRVGTAAALAGEIVNTATLSDAGGHPPATDTFTTTIDEAPPAGARLAATLIDTFIEDADGDGRLGAGDVVGYTAVINNLGPAATTGVRFTLAPDPHTHLIPASVTTTAGTIDTGSGPGDTHVAVTLGDLAAGTDAVVTFEVRLADPLPTGLDKISAQGDVTAIDAAATVTDDPSTPQPLDPTVTPLGDDGPPAIVEIPTLHGLGLTALAALLTAVAFRRLRPAPRTAR